MPEKEKLAELISGFLGFLPWGQIGSRTGEELAEYLLKNGVRLERATSDENKRWIPVSERLPEYGQEVIVYTGNILKPIVMAYTFWKAEYDTWLHVTHWMPMPEGPEVAEHG